jgi:hypothetical protein
METKCFFEDDFPCHIAFCGDALVDGFLRIGQDSGRAPITRIERNLYAQETYSESRMSSPQASILQRDG